MLIFHDILMQRKQKAQKCIEIWHDCRENKKAKSASKFNLTVEILEKFLGSCTSQFLGAVFKYAIVSPKF